MKLKINSSLGRSNLTPKRKLVYQSKLAVLSAIGFFALFVVFGLSFFTGNEHSNGAGISRASALEPADINSDGNVDVFDLSLLLISWGNTGANAADIDADGNVNVFDLSRLLTKWGPVGGTVLQCTPLTTGQGGYPLPNLDGYANDCNTGPRYPCTITQGTLITSYDGQVIDRMCINGSLEIRHNNVTVRDVLVMGTGTYAIDIGQDTAVCPANLRVEYTEVNMTNAGDIDWGIYQRCAGGHVFDHIKVMYAGRGIMTYGNLTINQSYVYSNRTVPDAHRTAFSTHGGSGFTITGNTLICVNTGCSSSLNIYSDYAPATDILIQGNVVAGGSICMRGGETHTYATQTHDIRVLNNRFSTVYAPECGTYQAFAQFDEAAPGNVRSGNVWHESGLPITGE